MTAISPLSQLLMKIVCVFALVVFISQCNSVNSDPPADDKTNEEVTLLAPQKGTSDMATSVTFNWEVKDSTSKFNIEVAPSEAFDNLVLDQTVSNTTTFTASIFNHNTTYYWRVRSENNSHNGEWSEVWSFSTKADQQVEAPGSFVSVENGEFVLDGQPFEFVGTNAYYLPNYEELDPQVVDRALESFDDAGLIVIRMWALYDGYDCGYSAQDPSETVIQTEPGVYNEKALKALDRVVAQGKERGMRFVLTLVNYWDDLGGICQYNTWDGIDNPSKNLSHFIKDEDTQRWFKNYVSMLLNRTNTETGVKYKNEPAVFSWEIMNEGQLDGGDPQVMRNWYQEIAQYIKSIDENHMVATGEEGYDENKPAEYTLEDYSNTYVLRANRGTSFIKNTAIPEIDYATAHWYPANWGFGRSADSDLLTAQRAWIRDHQEIAQSYGKPFVLGEYGFPGWGDERTAKVYKDLYTTLQENDVAGDMVWQLAADWVKCWEYGGNICWPQGRQDTTLYNNFANHINKVSNRN